MLGPRQQGDLGEQSAVEWLWSEGYTVFAPFGHSPDIDLIALRGAELVRVQVKTSRVLRNGRWEVTLCTRGGNRSWNGVTKTFDRARCDLLFVLVADGRRWAIPADRVEAGSHAVLGGPKYAAFEVARGRPFETSVATLA